VRTPFIDAEPTGAAAHWIATTLGRHPASIDDEMGGDKLD